MEDVELQRDIEAATGKTLQRRTKKKRKTKHEEKYPNLTDITRRVVTAKQRLGRRIFNR